MHSLITTFHNIAQPRDSGPSVIDVHVNKMYDTGPSVSERDPGERSDISFLQRKRGPTKRIPFTALLVERYRRQFQVYGIQRFPKLKIKYCSNFEEYCCE